MSETVPDILARIVARKREELARAVPGSRSGRCARKPLVDRRDFRAALSARPPAIIAEIKKASPSKGVFAVDFDAGARSPRLTARRRGGAFGTHGRELLPGQPGGPRSSAPGGRLPVLRKDFTIDACADVEAAAHGADAILLIAAILSEREIRDFREAAARYRMAALVEVHNRAELEKAVAAGSEIIGVNNRDLTTFEVTLETSLRLAEYIPDGAVSVSESGIHDARDIATAASGRLSRFPGGRAAHAGGRSGGGPAGTAGGMILKICGITNPEDAAAAVEGGANASASTSTPTAPGTSRRNRPRASHAGRRAARRRVRQRAAGTHRGDRAHGRARCGAIARREAA